MLKSLKSFAILITKDYGAWKIEAMFSRARFIRQKCYVEEIDEKLKVTCAGLPPNCYDYVTFDNFRTNFSCKRKINIFARKRWRIIN